jgi:hypothetical protein
VGVGVIVLAGLAARLINPDPCVEVAFLVVMLRADRLGPVTSTQANPLR